MDCTIVLGAGKREVILRSPLLAGPEAYGWPPFTWDWPGPGAYWGAYVTPVLTRHARKGAERSSFARTTAGYVLHTGRRNPGLRRALRDYGRDLARLGVPVLVALSATSPEEVADAAAMLAADERVQGIVLHVSHEADAREVEEAVDAATSTSPLPCLACLPAGAAASSAVAAEEAGASALVVAGAPFGRARDAEGRWVYGPLDSPALAPHYVELVHQVARRVSLPIIARGAATPRDALDLLAAGAVALELGSIVWVDPEAPAALHAAVLAEGQRLGAADWETFLERLRG